MLSYVLPIEFENEFHKRAIVFQMQKDFRL
jgi:hypothetical protein